jgi:hypothetical protein
VLALWELLTLGGEHLKAPGENSASLTWGDDVINVATLCCLIGVGVAFGVFIDEFCSASNGVISTGEFTSVDDFNGTG